MEQPNKTEFLLDDQNGKPKRLLDVYGVLMNPIENMRFSKYIQNENIAMNTKTKDQRKQIAFDWLQNHLKNKSA